MNINITAIRSNGSPITSNFNDIEKLIDELKRWDADSFYGGLIRIFMNYETTFEETFRPAHLATVMHDMTTRKVTREFDSVNSVISFFENENVRAATNSWTSRPNVEGGEYYPS
jgi:hypothetical protein